MSVKSRVDNVVFRIPATNRSAIDASAQLWAFADSTGGWKMAAFKLMPA